MMFRIMLFLLLPVLLWVPIAGTAQILPESDRAAQEAVDPWGRTTPRGTVNGLVAAFAADDPSAILPYLDLSNLPEVQHRFQGRRIGIAVQQVLDRSGGLLPGYRISSDPGGQINDGLPPEFDVFAAVVRDGVVTDMILRRAEDQGQLVWRVAPASLVTMQDMALTLEAASFEAWVPTALNINTRVGGVTVTAWVATLILGAGSLALAGLVTVLVIGGASRLLQRVQRNGMARVLRDIRLPFTLILGAVIFQVGAFFAGIPVVARSLIAPVVEIGSWLAIAWLLWRIIQATGDEVLQSMTRRERLGAVSVVALARRVALALVVAFALVFIASSLGLNLTGWFAALGLGGLAFALGAQKTIEHMVGGLSIVADQPIRIGDFCQIDGLLGTVEDIGLRSTRIRTLERTLVTIPNGDLSAARIENFFGRDRFRWLTTIGLRYETPPEQMRAVLWQLDQLLAGDERIAEDHRARFIGFGPSSLDIEILAYIIAEDYPSSLAIREELNLIIMEIIGECGASFAFPSTTVYLEDTSARKVGEAA